MAHSSAGGVLDATGPFYWLDGNQVVGAWRSSLSATLLELHDSCSLSDLVALKRFSNFIATHEAELQALAQAAKGLAVNAPAGAQNKYPVCTTLLLRRSTQQGSVALDLILGAICEAALEASSASDRGQIGKVTSALRGALEQAPDSRLQLVLGRSKTLAEVHGRLQQEFADPAIGQPTLAPHWRRWLGPGILRWLTEDRSRLCKALAPADLVPPEDATTTTIQVDMNGDPDDALEIPTQNTVEEEVGAEIPKFKTERARARASALERASEGDLLSHPDWSMPVELIQKTVRGALEFAGRYIENGELHEAEPYVGLVLAVATGLRESDLPDLRWGPAPAETAGRSRPSPRLDISEPLMHWPIVHPPSTNPVADPQRAMEKRINVFRWPLPPTVHRLVLALRDGAPRAGESVFPSHERGAKLPLALRDTVKRIAPGLLTGAGAVRRAFASELARAVGPDVAQLTLGDAFSHSVAQTYYAAPRVSAVTSAICSIQARWFDESATVGTTDGFFGSRIVPKDDASRDWPKDLNAQRRSAARRKPRAATDEWIAHRNFLAGSLCAATAHRPVDSLGKISLHDVVPEHGLITLRDKQIDPLRKVRVAATGAFWIAELRDYLDRLIDLSAGAADSPTAELAGRVLRADAPLFSAPAMTGETFNSAVLVSTMPTAFQAVRNHYRHRLNQQLLWRSVDPELRYAQMGWVISPAHFTADLSPNAAVDLPRYLGQTIDEILIEDGWFSGNRRLAQWHWDGVPMPVIQHWDVVAAQHGSDHKAEVKRLREAWVERGKETEIKILPRLSNAIRSVLPRLCLDEKARSLVWAPEYRRHEPVEVDAEHCELIINIVRSQDDRSFEALETATTRILLHRLLKKSHKQEMTTGVLPRRPIFSATAEPSPFLIGSGCAVRHAEAIREILMDRIRAETKRDQGVLAVLSVLCFSPYRNLDWARAAVEAASSSARADNPGDWLRVAARIDGSSYQMVFNGAAALLLARRGADSPTAHAPTSESIDAWLKDHLPSDMAAPEGLSRLEAVVGVLRAAGRLELSGQERLLMLNGARFASAPVERCLAIDDRWPVQTRLPTASPAIDPTPSSILTPKTPAPPPRDATPAITQYRRGLLPLLNRKSLPRTLGKPGDSRYGLRSQQLDRLDDLRKRVGETSIIGLLTGFALQLIRLGGKKKSALRDVHTIVTRFAGDLLETAGGQALLAMDAAQLRVLYLTLLTRKTKKARAESVSEPGMAAGGGRRRFTVTPTRHAA